MGLGHVMRHALICTAAVAALAMFAGHAENAIAAPHQGQALGRVDVTGKLHAPNVSTSGHDVPLREALERIVPADYSINLPNAGAWAETPVSWQGGRSFVEALREALASLPEVSAKIDTSLQMITVRSRALPFGAAAQGQSPPVLAPAPQYPAAARPDAANALNTGNASPLAAAGDARPVAKTLSSPSAPPATPIVTSAPAALAAAPTPAPGPAPPAAPPPPAAAGPPIDRAPPPGSRGRGGASPGRPPTRARPPAAGAAAPTSAAAADTFPVPPPEVSRSWRLELADRTVKTALGRWAKEAGWQLVWEVPVDFGIDAEATVTGTFDEALHAIVRALDKSDTPIQAILYKGNKVLRIVAHGAAS